jgi:hypothetical protein
MSTAGDGGGPGGAGAGEKGVRTRRAGAGHAFMAQQPERVAQLIVEFLAASPRRHAVQTGPSPLQRGARVSDR